MIELDKLKRELRGYIGKYSGKSKPDGLIQIRTCDWVFATEALREAVGEVEALNKEIGLLEDCVTQARADADRRSARNLIFLAIILSSIAIIVGLLT